MLWREFFFFFFSSNVGQKRDSFLLSPSSWMCMNSSYRHGGHLSLYFMPPHCKLGPRTQPTKPRSWSSCITWFLPRGHSWPAHHYWLSFMSISHFFLERPMSTLVVQDSYLWLSLVVMSDDISSLSLLPHISGWPIQHYCQELNPAVLCSEGTV